MINVLFVCLGNICRSPLAEGIFSHKIKERGIENLFNVDSCGTSQYHIGEQPDPRTVANAKENGIILDHEARQFSKVDFKAFDYILAMDKANYDVIERHDQNQHYTDKFYLMRDFDPDFKGEDVPDPYFGGEAGFQHVFEIVDRSVDSFLEFLIKEHDIKESGAN
ncbi:low molecular weight phosphotyrosine protein phosphatase [Fulvivirga maritima]|uniref:low molecular weight protein-tyrosine-phosphatase n=1 Tax=Fulvivirga maritima TaxID=2904247 RepID=UPI001F27F59A|nr:low molecular weight protein-tyrosine-phosphatase [Fulvivirga maritima]UII29318.1 low molecular weight phosphotyrosine protein phosphatase [Fulvivirga maritima]